MFLVLQMEHIKSCHKIDYHTLEPSEKDCGSWNLIKKVVFKERNLQGHKVFFKHFFSACLPLPLILCLHFELKIKAFVQNLWYDAILNYVKQLRRPAWRGHTHRHEQACVTVSPQEHYFPIFWSICLSYGGRGIKTQVWREERRDKVLYSYQSHSLPHHSCQCAWGSIARRCCRSI